MANVCGKCANLELTNKEKYTSKDRYWCKEGHGYRELTDTCPNNYDFTYNPSSSNANDNGYTPAGCYITTIICQLLGYGDNCELLNILRNFRETVLKRDYEYVKLLIEYDTYGPIISDKIRTFDKNHRLCLSVLYNYLLPCVELINNNQYDLAVNKYKMMVNFLINWYHIETKPINADLRDVDMSTLGKGRIRLNPSLA